MTTNDVQNVSSRAPIREPQRNCFVISPIGPEGSETRKQADDFLELLVEPAVDKYGFKVTRADRIAHATSITSDVIRLVQESDICIIDLTANNPNVFYECGRRHETGRPFVQMVAAGREDEIAFDVSGIRTLTYDLSSPHAARESVLKLRQFIDAILAAGLAQTTSGDSLASIAQGIERVERKINTLLTQVKPTASKILGGDSTDPIQILLSNPQTAFVELLKRNDLDGAFQVLARLKRATPGLNFHIAVSVLASAGHADSYHLAESELGELLRAAPSEIVEESIEALMQGVKKYHENTGALREGQDRLIVHYNSVCTKPYSSEFKANVANAVGMIAWLGEDDEVCERYTRIAMDFCPAEPSYHYNLALLLEKHGRQAELDSCLTSLHRLSVESEQVLDYLARHGFSRSE